MRRILYYSFVYKVVLELLLNSRGDPTMTRTRAHLSSHELAVVCDRLKSDSEVRQAGLLKFSRGLLLGGFFAATRERLREVAGHHWVPSLANIGGCPAS